MQILKSVFTFLLLRFGIVEGEKIAKKMSKEEANAFEKVMKGIIDAETVFQNTGKKEQFVATDDQLNTYQKEFETRVQVEFVKNNAKI